MRQTRSFPPQEEVRFSKLVSKQSHFSSSHFKHFGKESPTSTSPHPFQCVCAMTVDCTIPRRCPPPSELNVPSRAQFFRNARAWLLWPLPVACFPGRCRCQTRWATWSGALTGGITALGSSAGGCEGGFVWANLPKQGLHTGVVLCACWVDGGVPARIFNVVFVFFPLLHLVLKSFLSDVWHS